MTGPRAPNLEAITESIQRSLQNCSLGGGGGRRDSNNSTFGGGGRHRSESGENMNNIADFSSDNTLELNSQIRLPYYWEQCLDLNTGEVYYINWRTGMKSRHHPRMTNARTRTGTGTNINNNIIGQELQEQGYVDSEGSYSEEEEESSSASPSPSSSTTTTTTTTTAWRSERCGPPMANTSVHGGGEYDQYEVESENESSSSNNNKSDFNYIIKAAGGREEVLVVAGCKGCFMYLMVPKQVEECPKCCGQLLHFDRSGSDN